LFNTLSFSLGITAATKLLEIFRVKTRSDATTVVDPITKLKFEHLRDKITMLRHAAVYRRTHKKPLVLGLLNKQLTKENYNIFKKAMTIKKCSYQLFSLVVVLFTLECMGEKMLCVWRPCISFISCSSSCLQNSCLRLVRFAHKMSLKLCLVFCLFIFPSIYYYIFRKLIVCVLNFELRGLFLCIKYG